MNKIIHHTSDARIIGTLHGFTVEQAKHEVDLHDGSINAFHFVIDPRDPEPRSRWLRALALPDGTTAIFDLRRIARSLATDLPGYTFRDQPGLIKYTLRPLYATAAALHAAVRDGWIAVGHVGPAAEAMAA